MNSSDEIISSMLAKAVEQSATPTEVRVLDVIARDTEGFDLEHVAGMIYPLCSIGRDDCSTTITRLLSKKLLTTEVKADRTWIFANYEALGVGASERSILTLKKNYLEIIGSPHAAEVMESLRKLLDTADGKLYLCTKLTEPNVFSELRERSAKKKETVVLMPRAKHIPGVDRNQYREIVSKWTDFVKSDVDLRKYVRVKTTDRYYDSLATSAISCDLVRFNHYALSSRTTRTGEIMQCSSGTSLYSLVQNQYANAYRNSLSLCEIWPLDYLVDLLKSAKVYTSILLLVIGIILTKISVDLDKSNSQLSWALALFATLPIGVFVNLLHDILKERAWEEKNLF